MTGNPPHDHTPDEERRIRDAALDKTIEGSFPASDPLSTLPNPGWDEAPGEPPDRAGNEGPRSR